MDHRDQMEFKINDTVRIQENTGTIKFIGQISGKTGTYLGIALHSGIGKNFGDHNGVRYFDTGGEKVGVFIEARRLQQNMYLESFTKSSGALESLDGSHLNSVGSSMGNYRSFDNQSSTERRNMLLETKSSTEKESVLSGNNSNAERRSMLSGNGSSTERRNMLLETKSDTEKESVLLENNSNTERRSMLPDNNSGTERRSMLLETKSNTGKRDLLPGNKSGTKRCNLFAENNSSPDKQTILSENNSGTDKLTILSENNSGTERRSMLPDNNSGTERRSMLLETKSNTGKRDLLPGNKSGTKRCNLFAEDNSGTDKQTMLSEGLIESSDVPVFSQETTMKKYVNKSGNSHTEKTNPISSDSMRFNDVESQKHGNFLSVKTPNNSKSLFTQNKNRSRVPFPEPEFRDRFVFLRNEKFKTTHCSFKNQENKNKPKREDEVAQKKSAFANNTIIKNSHDELSNRSIYNSPKLSSSNESKKFHNTNLSGKDQRFYSGKTIEPFFGTENSLIRSVAEMRIKDAKFAFQSRQNNVFHENNSSCLQNQETYENNLSNCLDLCKTAFLTENQEINEKNIPNGLNKTTFLTENQEINDNHLLNGLNKTTFITESQKINEKNLSNCHNRTAFLTENQEINKKNISNGLNETAFVTESQKIDEKNLSNGLNKTAFVTESQKILGQRVSKPNTKNIKESSKDLQNEIFLQNDYSDAISNENYIHPLSLNKDSITNYSLQNLNNGCEELEQNTPTKNISFYKEKLNESNSDSMSSGNLESKSSHIEDIDSKRIHDQGLSETSSTKAFNTTDFYKQNNSKSISILSCPDRRGGFGENLDQNLPDYQNTKTNEHSLGGRKSLSSSNSKTESKEVTLSSSKLQSKRNHNKQSSTLLNEQKDSKMHLGNYKGSSEICSNYNVESSIFTNEQKDSKLHFGNCKGSSGTHSNYNVESSISLNEQKDSKIHFGNYKGSSGTKTPSDYNVESSISSNEQKDSKIHFGNYKGSSGTKTPSDYNVESSISSNEQKDSKIHLGNHKGTFRAHSDHNKESSVLLNEQKDSNMHFGNHKGSSGTDSGSEITGAEIKNSELHQNKKLSIYNLAQKTENKCLKEKINILESELKESLENNKKILETKNEQIKMLITRKKTLSQQIEQMKQKFKTLQQETVALQENKEFLRTKSKRAFFIISEIKKKMAYCLQQLFLEHEEIKRIQSSQDDFEDLKQANTLLIQILENFNKNKDFTDQEKQLNVIFDAHQIT